MQGALRILLRSSEAISTANTETGRLGESCQQKNSPKIYNKKLTLKFLNFSVVPF